MSDYKEVHVVPAGDATGHDLHIACVCGPHVEPSAGGVVVTHHSLDGREERE